MTVKDADNQRTDTEKIDERERCDTWYVVMR